MMKLVTAALAISILASCQNADPEAARAHAQEYSKQYPDVVGVSCVATDSDGDGYCSCTIVRSGQLPLPIQCGCERRCWFNCARGCKYVETVKFQGRN